jgi:hypothetical protein
MSTTQTTTTTNTTTIPNEWANDDFQVKEPAVSNILDGISFWAEKTPQSGAIVYPRTSSATEFETVTWQEFEVS